MRLPIRVFWFMNYQLNRIAAEADLRAFRLGLTTKAPTQETVTEFEQKLLLELGDVVKLDGVDLQAGAAQAPEFDRAGFESLRMMF